jgi:hypothetical protein
MLEAYTTAHYRSPDPIENLRLLVTLNSVSAPHRVLA